MEKEDEDANGWWWQLAPRKATLKLFKKISFPLLSLFTL